MSTASLLTTGPVANSTLSIGAEKPAGKTAKLRGVNPATTDRDYSKDESEFLKAADKYKTENGRPFVSLSEAFRIMTQELGYQKWGVSA
jgi:hypothetical protein